MSLLTPVHSHTAYYMGCGTRVKVGQRYIFGLLFTRLPRQGQVFYGAKILGQFSAELVRSRSVRYCGDAVQ